MKKHLFNLGALLVAVLTLGGCSSEDSLTGYSRTWQVKGTATKAPDAELTRGMSIGGDGGKTLYYNWDGDETILVFNGSNDPVGTLGVTVDASNPALATIDGSISGTYSVGDTVTYYVPSVEMNFTGQKGTMADLSKNRSYLKATATVKEVDAQQQAITMNRASFKRRPAILHLRLTDGKERLNVDNLVITTTGDKLVQSVTADGTKTYGNSLTITPDREDDAYPNEFFIALLNDSEAKDTYTITARVGNSVYSSVADVQKITARLEGGKYYSALRTLTKTEDGDAETTGDFTFSTISPMTYDGSAKTPAVTVSYQGTQLTKDTDYDLHYFNNTDAGTAYILVVGKEGTSCAGKAGFTTFTINARTLTEGMLSSIADQTYTGSAIEPAVTVKDGDKTLVEGTDYTIAYANNIEIGTATVTIKGMGNYGGELRKTFEIVEVGKAVDLGMSVNWADVNVGAESETDYGLYFAWGETTGYARGAGHNFAWTNYKWCNGSNTTLTKYNTSSSYGTVDNRTTLELSDDAARVNMGGSWRMPTKAEWEELLNNTTKSWTTQNGVGGYKFVSKTDESKYIFLPAAGFCSGTLLYHEDTGDYYWSSSLYNNGSYDAHRLLSSSEEISVGSSYRFHGFTIRAVMDK